MDSLKYIIVSGFVLAVAVNYTIALNNETDVITIEYGDSVTIVSPNYPANYPNETNTQWLVSGPPNYQLIAVFRTFHLEPGNHDTLKIGSGLDPSNVMSLLVSLSDHSLPSDVISRTNEMWMLFTSDSSVTGQGFMIEITSGNITALGDGAELINVEYGKSVTVVSPNYPARYPNNAINSLFVSGPTNYQIRASFRTFHIERYHDTLMIGSGLDANNVTSLLVSLSGSSLPDDVISSSNEMWLVFTSDGSFTEQGFMIEIAPTNLIGFIPVNDYYVEEYDHEYDTIDITLSVFAEGCFEESCSDETTVCRCDHMCQFFGDCCPDHPLLIFNETLTNETWGNETLVNDTAMQPINLDTWECITDSFLPQLHADLNHGYRMVSRCPFGWSLDDDVKRTCKDNHSNVTMDVLYVNEDGTYFRNLGCAICHGFEESSLIAIAISANQECWWREYHTLECLTQPSINLFNMSADTNESNIPTINTRTVPIPRLCLDNTTNSCPNGTNVEVAQECQYYYKPYITDGVVGKHPACSQCNGDHVILCPSISLFPVESVDYLNNNDPLNREGIVDIFHMSEIPEFMVIQTLQCREGFELDKNYECAPIPSDWPVCQFKPTVVTPNKGSAGCLEDMLCLRHALSGNIISHLPCLVRSSIDELNDTMTFSFVYKDGIDPSLETIQNDIRGRVQNPRRDQCKNITISSSKSCYVEDNAGNMTEYCPDEVFTGHFLDFMPSLINNESLVFFNGTYIRPRWWSNISDIIFSSANISSKYKFTLCGIEVALQTCSYFVVTNDSVEWIEQENQSGVWHQGQMYDIEDILINPDDSIRICYIDQDTQSGGRALMILGHVLIAISSISLFATLVVYCVFPTLRNRQGVSIMNFIIALFLGQILLQYLRLPVSKFLIPCVIVAALSHFFFLASFVWTTIIAWDLSRSFAASKMRSFSSSSFGRKMVVFLLIGWGTPFACVQVTLVTQFGGFRGDPIFEYNSKTCWLTKLASIVMFFIPMSLCLLSNLVMFIITIHGVHSTKKSTSMLKEGQESQFKQWMDELRIYVKVSALLGFAWLFGFLAMVINVPFMDYLFVIVIGLQGVFIFISFGANKRVRKLWRTSIENSTLWTTLSRKEYTQGRSSTSMNSGHDSKKLSTTKI